LRGHRVDRAWASGQGAKRLRLYAHSALGAPGATADHSGAALDEGCVLLALNLDPARDALVSIPDLARRPFECFAVNAPDLLGQAVLLNGVELKLAAGGSLPETRGSQHLAGAEVVVSIHPLSYTFIRFRPG